MRAVVELKMNFLEFRDEEEEKQVSDRECAKLSSIGYKQGPLTE